MSWLLFCLYLLLFCYLVTVVPFFRKAGVPRWLLILVFTIKVAAGILYFLFYSLPANRAGSDTWRFYSESIPETKLLLHHPSQFFGELFISHYNSTGGLFADQQSFWNDLKDMIMIKLMAAVNIFTGSDYYCNIIFFNFFFLFGVIALYRLVKHWFPSDSGYLLLIIALLPSFLFWCSGIHKDGLLFSALALCFYSCLQVFEKKKVVQNWILIILMTFLVFLLRSYLSLLLVPSFILALLLQRFATKKYWVIASVFFAGCVFLVFGSYVHPSLNVPRHLSEKQAQFLVLKGNSVIDVPPLAPDIGGIIHNFPPAFDAAFFRPHLTEPGIMSKISGLEILCYWAFIGFVIWRNRKRQFPPLMIACIFFSVMVMMVIGYTIPFSGAIVRYRSLVLPFLVTPFIALHFRNNIIKNNM